MSSPPDLKTEAGILAYLESRDATKKYTVTILSGGHANYVYRVSEQNSTTYIIKHAAPLLHFSQSALDPTRMSYEARALEIFASPSHEEKAPSSEKEAGVIVKAARLLAYDEPLKLLSISDGGTKNLKDAYADLGIDVVSVGEGLAKWIAGVHTSSRETSLALHSATAATDSPVAKGDNNPIAVAIYRYSYMNLHNALSAYGHDTAIAEKVDEHFGSLLATDDECVCHGDFWPGNVLVREREAGAVELTVVDWEIVRRGTSATDIGQFAAEAFLLDRFKGGRGLLPIFLKTYVGIRQGEEQVINKAWVKRMIVHWAVHIAFWPTVVAWSDKEGTQKLVDIGVGVLKNVLDDDWEKLFESPLLKDGKDVWAEVVRRE